MYNILICDDDRDIVSALKIYLSAESSYRLFEAYTGQQAIDIVRQRDIQLILMDVMMPELDGIAATAKLRETYNIPIILLTAKSENTDKVLGLNIGADDYITKPFSMAVLHKRIEAVFRRGGQKSGNSRSLYDDGYLLIDFDGLTAYKEGSALTLTPTEFKLLRLLIANDQKVVTKTLILEKLWDNVGNFVDEHAVAVNINRLRKKLEDETHQYIKTMYGMGYQWKGQQK